MNPKVITKNLEHYNPVEICRTNFLEKVAKICFNIKYRIHKIFFSSNSIIFKNFVQEINSKKFQAK